MGNINFPGLSLLLHGIGNAHIRPVDVIPHNVSASDSCNDVSDVDPDPHSQLQFALFVHFLDGLDHVERHVYAILELLDRTAIGGHAAGAVIIAFEALNYVAVPNGTDFEDGVLHAEHIEQCEQFGEHLDHFKGRVFARSRSEPHDVSEYQSH